MTFETGIPTTKANVEALITALTGSETIDELLIIAKAAKGLNCSNYGDLVSVVESVVSTQTPMTSAADIMLSSIIFQAEYKASDSLPIGSIKPIFAYTDNGLAVLGGQHWLELGYIDSNTSNYPDARVSHIETHVLGTVAFYVEPTMVSILGIDYDGSYLWLVQSNTRTVRKWTLDGVYTGESHDLSATMSDPLDMCFDGEYFWVTNYNGSVHKFNVDWTSAGFSFDTTTESDHARGIMYDGTFLWVSSFDDHIVRKYTTSGVYTGDSFSTATETDLASASGLCRDGLFMWVINVRSAFKYDMEGNYTGDSIYLRGEDTSPLSACVVNGLLLVTGGVDKQVFSYTAGSYVGLSEAKVDTDTGLPLFVRIG